MAKRKRRKKKAPKPLAESKESSRESTSLALEFAWILRPVDVSRGRPRPLKALSNIEQAILAFDLEARHRLAKARVLFSSLTQSDNSVGSAEPSSNEPSVDASADNNTPLTKMQLSIKTKLENLQNK